MQNNLSEVTTPEKRAIPDARFFALSSMLPDLPILTVDDPKIMVFGLDFDGCTDRTIARQRLITHVIQYLQTHPGLERLIFDIFSLRQTVLVDYANACGNADAHGGRWLSCALLKDKFLNDLNDRIQDVFKESWQEVAPKIEFDATLLSDILNDLEMGTTLNKLSENKHYTLMPQHQYKVKNKSGHWVDLLPEEGPCDEGPMRSLECTDCSKLLLTYAHIHALASRLDHSFVYRIVDDRPDIMDGLKSILTKNQHLIPDNCRIQFLRMDSNRHIYPQDSMCYPELTSEEMRKNPKNECSEPSDVINGTGPINKAYQRDIRTVARAMKEPIYASMDSFGKTGQILCLLKGLGVYSPSDVATPVLTQSQNSIFQNPTIIRPIPRSKKLDLTHIFNPLGYK